MTFALDILVALHETELLNVTNTDTLPFLECNADEQMSANGHDFANEIS